MSLNDRLIKQYQCFNTERFYLDEHDEEQGFLCIVTSSISDPCPITLCRNIAKFCKKHIKAEKYNYIYVGPWAFKTNKI